MTFDRRNRTEMVYKAAQNASIYDNTCPASGDGFRQEQQGFDWSEQQQGVILGAFFWGYVASKTFIGESRIAYLSVSFPAHVPGGVLAGKYGGKYVLSLAVLSNAIFTLLTPVMVNWGGANALLTLRALEGICGGPTFPGICDVSARFLLILCICVFQL
jgi:MFS transporter, ACS family, solute carrier family 17 (sodium-dependent inorganic phosphate cotransporter), other